MHALLAISPHFDVAKFWDALRPNHDLWRALWTTVYVSVLAQIAGTLIGIFSAIGGMSRNRLARAVSAGYVWYFRGTPVFVQIFIWNFGPATVLGWDPFQREVNLGFATIEGMVLAGIVALAFNEGAYMSEIVRAGILAIDPGQMEAAKCVGMRRRMAMARIILPQAARVIVPGLGNEFNNMLKTSSLLSVIGVYELMQNAQVWNSQHFLPFDAFLAASIWYLALTSIWMLIQNQIERYFGAAERSEDERWFTRFFGVRTTPAVMR